MPKMIRECIDTWHLHMPDWEYCLWDENSFDSLPDGVENPLLHPFVQSAYKAKKYAFVADYVRFWALYNFGGIYLDTDMYVVRSLDCFLSNNFFAAWENSNQEFVSCGCIGMELGQSLGKSIILAYENRIYDETKLEEIIVPRIITPIINQSQDDTIYPYDYFYPFSYEEKQLGKTDFLQSITSNTYAIHLWNLSWQSNLQKIVSIAVKRIKYKLGINKRLN